MTESIWDESLRQARRDYAQFMKANENLTYAMQDSAIVGEVGPILQSYFPEFPRNAAYGLGVQALLRSVINDMWREMLDLAEEEGIVKFAITVERKAALTKALDEVNVVSNAILVEFTEELRDQLNKGGPDG